MADEPMPAPEYEHRACAVCGATTDEEAETRCQSYRDFTDEYCCCGGAEEDSYPDGRLKFVASGYAAKLDAWIERQMESENG